VGIVKNIEKVFPEERFPSSEVDLKNFQPVEFIDELDTFVKIKLFAEAISDVGRETVSA
jgi:hypothetical protein